MKIFFFPLQSNKNGRTNEQVGNFMFYKKQSKSLLLQSDLVINEILKIQFEASYFIYSSKD